MKISNNHFSSALVKIEALLNACSCQKNCLINGILKMANRNSPSDIKQIEDLTRLDEIVVDKRNAKRSAAKKRQAR